MTSFEGSKLDIVIFGATGFTGKCVVEEIVNLLKERDNITWGIAGRNANKLKDLLSQVSTKTGEDMNLVPVIVADISDNDALVRMAQQARVVVNCVGPYSLYGEQVVKACIEGGSHHLDISGELLYMETMQVEYNTAAEEKGVYVVSACGFDCIPTDMGVAFLLSKFQGEVNSVETYLQVWNEEKVKGAVLNFGTWESAVNGAHQMNEANAVHQKLVINNLPKLTPKLKPRCVIHRSQHIPGWSVPFLGSDKAVVELSQRHFNEKDGQRPAQIQTYVTFQSFLSVIALSIMGTMLLVLSKFQCGQRLLIKHPKFFTLGFISHDGPSEETKKNTNCSVTIIGEGWKEKLEDPTSNHSGPPNKVMVVKVSGKDPGYSITSKTILIAAITILRESNRMPGRGGVLPPAAAFAKTSFVEELNNHGIKFEVISSRDK